MALVSDDAAELVVHLAESLSHPLLLPIRTSDRLELQVLVLRSTHVALSEGNTSAMSVWHIERALPHVTLAVELGITGRVFEAIVAEVSVSSAMVSSYIAA